MSEPGTIELEAGAPTTWADIDEAIESSYKTVAVVKKEDPATVHAGRWCESVTAEFERLLAEQGLSVEHMTYAGWDIINHEFIVAAVDGSRFVVDPTWQQFLETPDANKPKVLKARLDELDQALEELGVPEKWRHVWKQVLVRKGLVSQ